MSMDASGPIPFRAAAAYGVSRPTVSRNAGQPDATTNRGGIPANGPRVRLATVDQVNVTAPPTAVDALVAGTVRSDINRGIGFDGDPPAPTSPGTARPIQPPIAEDAPLQLYNRHADRLEAATSVALGRSLDIQA